MKNIYAVVMAGGIGERFWPRSRKKHPKQLLPIISKQSMLQETIARLRGFVSNENILIVTNKTQATSVKKQVPLLPERNIIVEPMSKNTAICIAVAAKIIAEKDPNAVMVVLPSDHSIKDVKKFQKDIKNAAVLASKKNILVTLGIKPRGPHTGYGYIQRGAKVKGSFYVVKRFAEKPDTKTAVSYIKQGGYFWNSGIFIWKASTILGEIKIYLPELYRLCMNYSLNYAYKRSENISIDYAVMEKTRCAVVLEVNFDWDDVGSWSALDTHRKRDENGNVIEGDVVYKDVHDSIIMTDGILVAAVGVSDIVAVAEKGAVLICPKSKAEDVKQIVNILKKHEKHRKHI
jgi:mannose-1-phosphate guanylyltransferase